MVFADFNYTIINPETHEDFEEMKENLLKSRKGKATMEDAEKLLHDVNYFGVMLVKLGLADGMVSGAIHSNSGYGTSCPSNYQNKTWYFLVHQVSSL